MTTPAEHHEGRPQAGVDAHFAGCFEHIESDFRSSALNTLVASYVRPAGRVLDMGCGVGALSAVLIRQGNEVTSQDNSEAMVLMCRQHLAAKGISTRNVRLGGIDEVEEDAYDFAIALDVIEHVADDGAAARALRGALKPGGRLVLSVPALKSLYGPKDVRLGHYRRYHRNEIARLLADSGFDDIRLRYWNFIGLMPVWLSLKVKRSAFPESYRQSRRPFDALLNGALRWWFRSVENHINPPRGLTLLVTARRSVRS